MKRILKPGAFVYAELGNSKAKKGYYFVATRQNERREESLGWLGATPNKSVVFLSASSDSMDDKYGFWAYVKNVRKSID